MTPRSYVGKAAELAMCEAGAGKSAIEGKRGG